MIDYNFFVPRALADTRHNYWEGNMDLMLKWMEQARSRGQIEAYAVIPVEQIPFSPEVQRMCRSNQCGKYGTCWTCPPGANTQKLQEEIGGYATAWVFTCQFRLEDSFDFEGMMEGQRQTQGFLRSIMEKLRTNGLEFMALGCEGCRICRPCTYPAGPCRFPELAVPTVEACGIDVVELTKRTGLRYCNGAGTVTYFCILLCR